jgi:hypothetical protein
VSWLSQIAHEHGKTVIAALLVGVTTGSSVAVLIGRRQVTETAKTPADGGLNEAHIPGTSGGASIFRRLAAGIAGISRQVAWKSLRS